MFLVRNQHESFFASALVDGTYRFDPGCMSACDRRAVEVVSFFSGVWEETFAYEWNTPGQILVIDNRRTLHARPEIGEDDLG